MKVWLAESYDDSTYIFAQKSDDVGVLKMEIAGIFGNMIYDSGNFYERLSTDDKLQFVENMLRLLEHLEREQKRLDDIKIENRDFDVPEWLLLDDYNDRNDFDLVVNTKTKSTFKFEYAEGKILATFVNSNDAQCVKAKAFLDDMRKKEDNING